MTDSMTAMNEYDEPKRPARHHEAIYTIRVGRGYGQTDVPVVDLAPLAHTSTRGALHILDGARPLCGARGILGKVIPECDPKAVVVCRRPVCVTCKDLLGAVPMPELVERDG